MYLAFKAVLCLALCAPLAAQTKTLRVCADPNNLPYSNQQQQGFENALAKLLAGDMGATLQYVWEPQRSKFFRKTLNAGVCDVVMEVPPGLENVAASEPYYRSTYVFVTRKDKNLDVRSIQDPRLKQLRIGVHIVGDDLVPPARALIDEGMVRNLIGFSIFGRLSSVDPPAMLIHAVEDNKVDVAAAWGPLAGYFAKESPVSLRVEPICTDKPNRFAPMVFSIAMGVREGDAAILARLNDFIHRRKPDIDRLLSSYGVPLTTADTAQPCGGRS
jgi:quinoprotein dehydrogenase-associated probable ABC transporter substrate-binding protein